MNTEKYIHVKIKRGHNFNCNKLKHKPIFIDDYEKLPFREKIEPKNYRNHYKTQLDFWSIGTEYLKSKIGEYWGDVYKDMIKKTKPKFRYLLDEYISCGNPVIPTYYCNFIPYKLNRWSYDGIMIIDDIYINFDGILSYHKTREDAIMVAKPLIRREKLKRILSD